MLNFEGSRRAGSRLPKAAQEAPTSAQVDPKTAYDTPKGFNIFQQCPTQGPKRRKTKGPWEPLP
eukprot:8606969-Pyramimonas_sp.AAC.1